MSDWDVRGLYEQPPPELMEAEAFFGAFAKFHDIDGHRVECIFTKAKKQPLAYFSNAERNGIDGITVFTSVLLVRDRELSGVEQGGTLRVDGTHYRIMVVSRPIDGIIRMELEGYAG